MTGDNVDSSIYLMYKINSAAFLAIVDASSDPV
jgi:hypothetical protein